MHQHCANARVHNVAGHGFARRDGCGVAVNVADSDETAVDAPAHCVCVSAAWVSSA